MKKVLWSLLLVSTQTLAATIAVVDSGVDVQHRDLTANLWKNLVEIADNGRDEDRNGYQDDVWGWNFAEQNNQVIDRRYIGTFSEDPYRFFEIQGRMFLNQATEADKKWIAEKRNDPNFIKEMNVFGNFVHGTHVAGITVNGNIEGQVLSVKLIPTEVKPFVQVLLKSVRSEEEEIRRAFGVNAQMAEGLRIRILKAGLKALAGQQMQTLEEIAAYVGHHKADIANGSFGTGYSQAKGITDMLFKAVMFRKPNAEESDDMVRVFLNALITEGKKMMAAAPNTLFVFAAGNDGVNNDIYPTSPANIKADNVISVAATYKYSFIAPFSNYGTKNVDVAAPGMLIRSAVPGNEYLEVSGTSQAAPYVSNVAAQIKDTNPALTPKQIKSILMGTVDEKAFLANKVTSKGIVNMERAVYAAKLSLTTDVTNAISQAKVEIADVRSIQTKGMVRPFAVTPLPLIPMFK